MLEELNFLILLVISAARANDVRIFGAVNNEPVILEGPEKANVGDVLEFKCSAYGDRFVPNLVWAVNEQLVIKSLNSDFLN